MSSPLPSATTGLPCPPAKLTKPKLTKLEKIIRNPDRVHKETKSSALRKEAIKAYGEAIDKQRAEWKKQLKS